MATDRKLALVIDDEESMRDSCRQVLERDGWEVMSVPDGAAGLKVFHEDNPDLVLIDLKIPGVDGMKVLSSIAQEDPAAATVVITGYATVESAVEAMKLGAYDFLPKPFTPAELRVAAWRNYEKRGLLIRNRKLQAENERMKENFVMLVSHEMRAPLVAVDQYIEVLLGGLTGEVNAKQREILASMQSRTEWLLALVKGWLSISRLQGKTLREKMEPLDIQSLLNETVGLVAPQANEQQVEVLVSVPEAVGPLEGDKDALLHVFLNLVNNAVKYNKLHGKVNVCARVRDGEMIVDVRDTGRGIPEACLPFMFDMFYRVRTQDGPKTAGAGLGLSIVKKIVDAHGGHVAVSSTLGEGSTFTVHLPLRQPRDGQD